MDSDLTMLLPAYTQSAQSILGRAATALDGSTDEPQPVIGRAAAQRGHARHQQRSGKYTIPNDGVF